MENCLKSVVYHSRELSACCEIKDSSNLDGFRTWKRDLLFLKLQITDDRNINLHAIKEQEYRYQNVVALVVFQVLHHSLASFGYSFWLAESRTFKKLCPWLHLCFAFVQPFFSELYVRRWSYYSRHFNISSDFLRRHSLFCNVLIRQQHILPSPNSHDNNY